MDQYFRIQNNYSVFSGKISPDTSLKIKWHIHQRPDVSLQMDFILRRMPCYSFFGFTLKIAVLTCLTRLAVVLPIIK